MSADLREFIVTFHLGGEMGEITVSARNEREAANIAALRLVGPHGRLTVSVVRPALRDLETTEEG